MVTVYSKFGNFLLKKTKKQPNKQTKQQQKWAQYLLYNYVALIFNEKKQSGLWEIKLTLTKFDLNLTFPLYIPVAKMTLRFLKNISSSKCYEHGTWNGLYENLK